eukprot:11957345-Ditylum_brightwellii.AAC.1
MGGSAIRVQSYKLPKWRSDVNLYVPVKPPGQTRRAKSSRRDALNHSKVVPTWYLRQCTGCTAPSTCGARLFFIPVPQAAFISLVIVQHDVQKI